MSDCGCNSIVPVLTIIVDGDNWDIFQHSFTHFVTFFCDTGSVKTVNYFTLITHVERDDRLSVAVLKDRYFQKLHLWWRTRIGVVIISMYCRILNPQYTINRLLPERRNFVESDFDVIYGFNLF